MHTRSKTSVPDDAVCWLSFVLRVKVFDYKGAGGGMMTMCKPRPRYISVEAQHGHRRTLHDFEIIYK